MSDEIVNEEVQSEEAVEAAVEASPAPVAAVPKAASAPVDESRANGRKVREGIVVSDKMEATIVVAVQDRVRHPRYRKTVQRTKRLYVHDAENSAKLGDRVQVVETRPLSKLKHWRLQEILERAR